MKLEVLKVHRNMHLFHANYGIFIIFFLLKFVLCGNIIMKFWGDVMLDVIKDSFIDLLKLIPFLFVAFLILEYIEHKMSKKNEKILTNNGKFGPIVGGILGAFPQCGFSAMATKLFSSRVITLGTLISVYLSTSDEMLPIMISNGTSILTILKIIGIKVLIGIIMGFIIDLFYKNKSIHHTIHEECENEHCHCEKGIFVSSIHHTLNIAIYLLITILLLNIIIYFVGEDVIKNYLLNNRETYFISSLIGLIPNCASSVIMTEIYISGLSSFGFLVSGLLTGAGVGLLILFKTNKNIKENIMIVCILYLIGVIVGYLIDLIGISI